MNPHVDHVADLAQGSLDSHAVDQGNAAGVTPAAGLQVNIHPVKKVSSRFDQFVAKVRDNSPAWLVNSGSQISLSFKGGADILSIWSSLRRGAYSPWRFAGSALTLFAEVLGAIIPEKKISEEKQEEYTHMSRWQYFKTKTREAFDPKNHIAETSGMALIVNGFCLAMAGLNQSSKKKISWEILQGMMTSAAGVIMNYMPDRERAWQVAHTTFMVRSIPAALQAQDAWKNGFPHAKKPVPPGDWQQWGKWILNQIANIFGTLYGGVKKMPDGTIVHIGKQGEDNTAPRQSRQHVASGKEAVPLLEHPKMPDTKITHAKTPHKMLEHHAVAEQMEVAG